MKRYIFRRHPRHPIARKLLLGGIAASTMLIVNAAPFDIPEFALSGKDATAATSPTQSVHPVPSEQTSADAYLTTGFLDGLLVDRPYDEAPRRATHIPEIADEYI